MGIYPGHVFAKIVDLGPGFIAKALYVFSPYAFATYGEGFDDIALENRMIEKRFAIFGIACLYTDRGSVFIQKTKYSPDERIDIDPVVAYHILRFIYNPKISLKISYFS